MPHGLMQGSPLLPAPAAAGGGGGGGGVSSHHDLTDLGTYDDHAQYVNVSEVLHLWERLDAPTIPDTVAERTA